MDEPRSLEVIDPDIAWLDEPLDAETMAICNAASSATIPWDPDVDDRAKTVRPRAA